MFMLDVWQQILPSIFHCMRVPLHARAGVLCAEEATSEEAAERTLDGDDAQRWQEALESVQAIGFEEPEADTILRKAFGWSGQGYWRRSREYEVPTAGQACLSLYSLQASAVRL